MIIGKTVAVYSENLTCLHSERITYHLTLNNELDNYKGLKQSFVSDVISKLVLKRILLRARKWDIFFIHLNYMCR